MKEETKSEFRVSLIQDIQAMYKSIDSEDLVWVYDEASSFLKNQAIKNAIISSVDLLDKGDFNGIKTVINDALLVGDGEDLGVEYFENINERYLHNSRIPVKTPWGIINEITNGGLGAGEMGCILAGPGAGKTWALCKLGIEAMKNKLNVVHYTLELSKNVTCYRYDSIITGFDNSKLIYLKDSVVESIESKREDMGRLVVKQFPTKGANVQNIYAHLKKIELLKFKPNLVIIDYGDLLSPSRIIKGQENSYHTSGGIYEEIRGLAVDFNVPIWTASQVERMGSKENVIDGTHIAESFKKIHISDFVMSISRKTEDTLEKTARYHIIKNRNGLDKVTYDGTLDPSIGHIEIFPTKSVFSNKVKTPQEKKVDNDMKSIFDDKFKNKLDLMKKDEEDE